MRLRVLAAFATLVLVLAAAIAAALYLERRANWPGWDEAWALVLLPLGVPLAAAAGLWIEGRAVTWRAVTFVTLAVWAWGALLFAAWLVLD
jgi:hypothetical protein